MDGKCYEKNPLCWLNFHLWCVMVDPRYIYCHITPQTPFLFRWNLNKHFFPIINMRSSFLSIVSKQGTHLVDYFSYPNPCEEYLGICGDCVKIINFSHLDLAVIYHNIMDFFSQHHHCWHFNWATWMMSIKDRGSATFKLIKPMNLMVVIEGNWFLYVFLSFSLIFSYLFPPKNKM